MAKKIKDTTNQLLNVAQDSYLERTSRPFYALVFLLPFIAFYELGTIFINTDVLNEAQIRVVAFVWLQEFLRHIGFGGKFLWAAPALMVVVILVAYQIVSRKQWWISPFDFIPMTVECILLAVPLIVLSLLLHSTSSSSHSVVASNIGVVTPLAAKYSLATGHSSSLLADIVTGIGAGIYEELLFRLILICALMLLFQDVFKMSKSNSIVFSVLASAALFGAHHHIDFLTGQPNHGDLFDWTKFIFRTMAGIYFAVLFAMRGFGIAAGTHAFYDIIATLINALIFHR